MNSFADRTEEMETLEQEYLRHGASFVVVYAGGVIVKQILTELSNE